MSPVGVQIWAHFHAILFRSFWQNCYLLICYLEQDIQVICFQSSHCQILKSKPWTWVIKKNSGQQNCWIDIISINAYVSDEDMNAIFFTKLVNNFVENALILQVVTSLINVYKNSGKLQYLTRRLNNNKYINCLTQSQYLSIASNKCLVLKTGCGYFILHN